jgi:hypothetical protein
MLIPHTTPPSSFANCTKLASPGRILASRFG